jgi:hypothetical protein
MSCLPTLSSTSGISSLKPAADIERWYATGFHESKWFEERPAGSLARAVRRYAVLAELVLALALWHTWAYGAAGVACRGGGGAGCPRKRPSARKHRDDDDNDGGSGGEDDHDHGASRLELRP